MLEKGCLPEDFFPVNSLVCLIFMLPEVCRYLPVSHSERRSQQQLPVLLRSGKTERYGYCCLSGLFRMDRLHLLRSVPDRLLLLSLRWLSRHLPIESKGKKLPPTGFVQVPISRPASSLSRTSHTFSNFGRRMSACFLMCAYIPCISLKNLT